MALKNFSSADNEISVTGAPDPDLGDISKKKDVKKRWMMVGIAGAGMLVMASIWMTAGQEKKPLMPERNQRTSSVIDTTPKGLNENQDWRTQTGAELVALRRALSESTSMQQDLLNRMREQQAEMESLKKSIASGAGAGAGAASEPAQARVPSIRLPEPPAPPARLQAPPQQPTPVPSAQPGGWVTPTPPAVAVTPSIAPTTVSRAPARAFLPSESVAAQSAGQLKSYEKNPNAGFLPAGSFSKATMISGVEAFTGGTAQSQPQPVVVRIDANAVLPNAARYQIRGCHVLASVWGDMSSERVYGRLATLTCVDAQDNLVLSQEVEGVLVDSDGKNGIRGQLIDRQGAKLARALLAGLAEGMSDALGAAQTTSMASGMGVTTALTGNQMAAAGYGGASKAAEQLSEFYLKQAEATMPVIAVDAGRRISVLFTKSQSLEFESSDLYRPKTQTSLTVQQ